MLTALTTAEKGMTVLIQDLLCESATYALENIIKPVRLKNTINTFSE